MIKKPIKCQVKLSKEVWGGWEEFLPILHHFIYYLYIYIYVYIYIYIYSKETVRFGSVLNLSGSCGQRFVSVLKLFCAVRFGSVPGVLLKSPVRFGKIVWFSRFGSVSDLIFI